MGNPLYNYPWTPDVGSIITFAWKGRAWKDWNDGEVILSNDTRKWAYKKGSYDISGNWLVISFETTPIHGTPKDYNWHPPSQTTTIMRISDDGFLFGDRASFVGMFTTYRLLGQAYRDMTGLYNITWMPEPVEIYQT